jgi:hypothetical protein
MRARDLTTLEIFLAEYGSSGTGAPSYGKVGANATAKKTMGYAKDLAGGRNGPGAAAASGAAQDQAQGAEIKKVQNTQDKIVGDAQEGDQLEVDGEQAEVVSAAGEGDNPDVVVVRTASGKQHELPPDVALGESFRKLVKLAGKARTDESRRKVRQLIEQYVLPKPTATDRFLGRPLDQQLLMLENLDPPRSRKKITEGGVPDNSRGRALNKLLGDHFPVGDYGKQMEAYIALPVPSMLRDFWALEANEGANACARWIVREYIKKFAPDSLRDTVKLDEARKNLREYENLEQARKEILDRLNSMNLSDENPDTAVQNKNILDKIYTVLNKNNVMGRIGEVLPNVLKGEYPDNKILEIAGEMMKAPLSYKDREKFINNLAKDRVINYKLLLAGGQYPIDKLVFNDEVNLIMFDHLKGFGVGQQMKGPAEHALAILSTKISIQGKGDVDVDGTPVEIKAAVGSKKGAGGGRFGEAGHLPTREMVLNIISKYEQINTIVQVALERQNSMNIETLVSLVNKSGIEDAQRKQFAKELFSAIFGNEATRVIQEFSKPNADPNTVRIAYIKSNFDWYKNSDQGGAWEILSTISFPDGVIATIKSADDLDKIDIYKKNPYVITTGKPQEMLFQFNPKSMK